MTIKVSRFFFGPSFSGKRGRGSEKKELVIVAVSVWKDKGGKERPGFVHALVAENADAETIENILKRLDVSAEEIEPLINVIRSDGWRRYQTVTKKLGIVHNRAVLCDPKDSMKLLPWTHKIIANAKAVFAGPHRCVSKTSPKLPFRSMLSFQSEVLGKGSISSLIVWLGFNKHYNER